MAWGNMLYLACEAWLSAPTGSHFRASQVSFHRFRFPKIANLILSVTLAPLPKERWSKMNPMFSRRMFLKYTAMGLGCAYLAACAAPVAAPGAAPEAGAADAGAADAGQLEIFSWWTAGGEVEGLNNLFEIYERDNPGVEIINAAVAAQGAGQGGEMKALLETRMMGGDPPESFQVHLGRELIDSHVIAGRMEP